MRHFSIADKVLSHMNDVLDTVFAQQTSSTHPAADVPDVVLSEAARKQSEGYMRVNHTGEVCAQALYRGQLLASRNETTRDMLIHSCNEETAHLAWTKNRLDELNGRTSYLNPLWYMNSFLIGVIAGLAGDKWSLGFIEETEMQVDRHLQSHLKKLPPEDLKSRVIVEKMREDELSHAESARKAGAVELPFVIQKFMQLQAKVMTSMAYYV